MAYVYTQRVYVSHKNCLKVHANITINVNNQNQLGVHVFGCLFMLICIYTSIPSLYRLVEPGPNCLVALQEGFFGLQCQGHATVVNMCTKKHTVLSTQMWRITPWLSDFCWEVEDIKALMLELSHDGPDEKRNHLLGNVGNTWRNCKLSGVFK